MKKTPAKNPKKEKAAIEEKSYESVSASLLAGRNAEAEEQIHRILGKWPRHLQALNDLGVIYALRGEKEKAFTRFLSATQNDNTDRIAIHNLLGSLLQMGRRDDAIATLKSAMESDAGQDLVDIIELYLGVLSDSKDIPGPLFHFMKSAAPPISPQGTPDVGGNAIMGRVACLGKDALQFIRFSSNGSIKSYNQQKGRVDLFLDVLRGGQKPKASVLERFMERKDVYPLIVEQENLPWLQVKEKVQLLLMDSFSELTDLKFTHRAEGWSFCSHYTDLIHNEAFEAIFENRGHLPIDRLAQTYWDFFTWFENNHPEAHVAYIHFPTKLDDRKEFKKRAEAIRAVMAELALIKPYILNIDIDESLVDWNENDRFPYHFSQSTNKAIADRWIRLEDNRPSTLQGKTIKTACVVQGDIRRGTVEVLKHVARHFDVVILSTWKSDEEKVPSGDFKLILNDKPEHFGATNRNMQRRTTSAGIALAESLGCTHVMKLRTDMLPTLLDMRRMLAWAHFNVPDGIPSRIVTCAFRNITVEPDWFSSIPDLFSFGSIEMMKLLWGDSGFHYTLEMNVPQRMTEQCGSNWEKEPNRCGTFCAESELYAIFKDRLEKIFKTPLNHAAIAKQLLYLIDHESLGMCWFHPENGFRSILQALEHPWWTPQQWRTSAPVISPPGYYVTEEENRKGAIRTRQAAQAGIEKQYRWHHAFSQRLRFHDFSEFVAAIHAKTREDHDTILRWAENCEMRSGQLESPELFRQSDNILVRNGYSQSQELQQRYKNRFASLSEVRILIQVPPLQVSPGGYSLFTNMMQALSFIGVPVRVLGWDEPIGPCLSQFKPTVFMTSDHQMYLSRIDWKAVKEYRRTHDLKIGLTASLQEYGNTPLSERLQWCRQHNVDFFYSFRAPEYLNARKEYRPFFDNGYKIFSIEFGANPLIHYPVPDIAKDIDYIFLASSNADKWPRYFAYLSDILTRHPGFIDGPGWGFQNQSLALNKDRYLYARAKIGLNLHLNEQIEWPCELNERTYILAACGVPQLIDNPQLLPRRFDEKGFFNAHSPKEYQELFETILHFPEEAAKRALVAQREVFQSHTWFHRAEGLVLSLMENFFSRSEHGLLYGSDLYRQVNSNICGSIGRVGGSFDQLLKYENCNVEDINLKDGGFGKADDRSIIVDMHDAHKDPSLRNKYDCLVSSNVIEHSYNPIFLLLNYYFVTKKGGYQFHAIPNYRYTYDVFRKPTLLEHFIEDFEKKIDRTDLTHKEDYIQSAIAKHGWQREFHNKYPVSYPYMHNHVFDEHNTKALMEFVFQEVTVDVIRTGTFSDNVVLFRNSLTPVFVARYGDLIRRYFGNDLSGRQAPEPEHSIAQTAPLRRDKETATMDSGNKSSQLLSQISKATRWKEGSPLRLHLGCGEQHLDGYVNIDHPPSAHTVQKKIAADYFADITTLDFPEKSVDEIRLHHVFEHFNRSVALALLIKWRRWLKLGGRLQIETPDLIGSAKTLLSSASWSTKMGVVRHIAGSHEAAWAYHIDHWFPERFQHTLKKLGYGAIEVQSTAWSVEPYLSNVSVTAMKTTDVSMDALIRSADELLWESTVAPSETAMVEVWKHELRTHLLPMRSEELGTDDEETTKNGADCSLHSYGNCAVHRTGGVIFSKDRAMQLDCTLRSFYLHCKDTKNIQLNVLYTTSSDLHEAQYSILRQQYRDVEFIREKKFKEDLVTVLSSCDYILFLVDDNIFVGDVVIDGATTALDNSDSALGVSLRLGKNTTYSYMLDKQQALPLFREEAEGLLSFDWTTAELDFGYPLELSSSIYRTADILPLLRDRDFTNPNTLELQMDAHKSTFQHKNKTLICFPASRCFCNPVNMVQTAWGNRAGKARSYTPDNLRELFDQGLRINVDCLSGYVPKSCHEEVDFAFVDHKPFQEGAQPNGTTVKSPFVTIGIANWNGMQHIKLCLESIRRNTPEPHEIIVVDNGSTDGSREYLQDQEDIILILNTENVGAPGARNQFLSISRGDYIVFLDNDTIVTKDWIKKLVKHMEADSQIGIIGACTNYATGLQGIPGVVYKTIEELEEYASRRALAHRGELLPSPRLISFCVFIRREAVDKVGSMETGFSKFCFEDDDYALRISIAGFRSVVAHDVFIHHSGGPQGRGDKQYNQWLIDAWDGFKRKWGLPQELPFGSGYDAEEIASRPFDPNLHHIPPYDRDSIERLIWRPASVTDNLQKDVVSRTPALTRSEFTKGTTSIIVPAQSIHLTECISSITRYTDTPHEVIFLDHGAAPKVKKRITKAVKENHHCKVIKIDGNVNFTRSINEGINQSTGEYIVLLFDDVVVGEGWLSDMHACLHSSNRIAIVGAMSNDASSLQRAEGIDFNSVEERTSFRERNRHRRIPTRNLDGFCMLFRRDLLARIGLFDELFIEDKYVFDDFCVRAVLEGYNNIIAGNVFVHNGGGINRLLSRDKTLFDEKWIGLDASTPLAEKVLIVNAMETARSQYQKGAIEDAVNILILRIGFSPNEKQLYFRLAEILLAENRFQDAVDALKGTSVAEDDAEYHALLGYGNEGLGFYQAAEEYADKALAIDGKSAPAFNLKGILSCGKGDMRKAEEWFTSAIEADPGYGDPYTHMGILRWKTEQKEEAVDLFEKGFILSPDKGDIITGYYTSISSLERQKRAETVFREARSAYPENKRILFLLIDILLKQDKFQEAMKEVEKAMVHFGMDEGILSAALEIRRKIGAKSIAVEGGKAKPAATLSVCMIVKNEERYLAYCLNSLSPVADEMIVVDTGSTDRTKEIAEAFGAHVYDFEWVNDFAAARNYSLSKAQGDWILVMDADEVISFQDHAKLRRLVNGKEKIAYNMITRNYVHKTAGDGWTSNDNTYIPEQAGRGWFPSSKVRLFPNNGKIRFEKPIHELVEYSIQRIGLGRKESGIPVHHYGELDAKKATAKDAQYYELGVQKLKESGGDFRSVWELAVQAGELGKTEESIELWHKVLEFKHKEAAAYFNLANHYLQLGKYEDSYDCSRKSYALDPMDQSAVLSYAMSEFFTGDINKTISALEGFLKGTDSHTSLVGLLAVSYLLSGKKDRGLKYLRGLVRKKYDCVYYFKDLSKTLIAAGNLARAKSLLTTAIEIKFYDQETLSLLAQCEAGTGNDYFVEQKM